MNKLKKFKVLILISLIIIAFTSCSEKEFSDGGLYMDTMVSVTAYGENCEDLIGFTPTCYVTLTKDVIDTWFAGLSEYTIFNGKVNDIPYKAYYTAQLKVRAMEGGASMSVKAYMHAPLFDNE